MSHTIFEPDEAEEQVRALRHQLRESSRLEGEGQTTAAHLALWRAYDIRDELIKRLQNRFWREANAGLENYPSDAIEDAVSLMMGFVTSDLMNLEETPTALAYENARFNGIVYRRILGALKTVRRQEKYKHFGRPLSLDEPVTEDEDSQTRGAGVEDHRALPELDAVFDREIVTRFKRSLSPEQLQIVALRVRYPDASATQLAKIARIPERTARHRLGGAMKLLIGIIRGEK